MFEKLKNNLTKLMTTPVRSQIKIDFDSGKGIFILSATIFYSKKGIPLAVRNYVEAREEKIFLPHQTSYFIKNIHTVCIMQKIPFQSQLRKQVNLFLDLAKNCSQTLAELSAEEKIAKLGLEPKSKFSIEG